MCTFIEKKSLNIYKNYKNYMHFYKNLQKITKYNHADKNLIIVKDLYHRLYFVIFWRFFIKVHIIL